MKGKIGAFFLAIVMVVGLFGCVICLEQIPAGYVGVVYNMNGGVDGEVLTQGWHLVAPSKRVTEYSIGLEQSYLTADEQGDSKHDESFKVPTSDGMSGGKKLFVITCNSLHKLSEFLINRPGRFHYHFRFDYPNADEIREYMTDKIPTEMHGEIDAVIAFAARVRLNYDCLRAIAFELSTGLSFA